MFESVPTAPPDAILGLTEVFKKDPNPEKINLSVGVYKDVHGTTPILRCVKEAENRLLKDEVSKSYLPIDGSPQYAEQVQALLLGRDHEILQTGRAATLQTPGGTGAVRLAADFVKQSLPSARVWCTDPTWPNHPKIFSAAGLEQQSLPYFDLARNSLDFDALLSGLRQIPAGDVVLLHPCCHNPTGVDPAVEQWKTIAEVVFDRGILPLLDFAYQGFGRGLREDAQGLLQFCRPNCELIVCNSFSKNFGLYNERVGGLTVVGATRKTALAALSQLKACVRANYSNPPVHGAAIVATILKDDELRGQWEEELTEMRDRINGMRRLFAKTMQAKGASRDFSFVCSQLGMFSFSGLSPEQVDRLRDECSIYIVRNGRINVAGITPANTDRLCQAICAVL
jgi:aspartate/tyrosine/aromatic aminotransferase